MQYYCDISRHLICIPYSIANLHKMAEDLQLNKCWFHSKGDLSHYDIPKKRISEFLDNSKIKVISSKELFKLIKNGQ